MFVHLLTEDVSQSPFYFNCAMSSSAQISFQTINAKDNTEFLLFLKQNIRASFLPMVSTLAYLKIFEYPFHKFLQEILLLCFREREITCHFSYRKTEYAD